MEGPRGWVCTGKLLGQWREGRQKAAAQSPGVKGQSGGKDRGARMRVRVGKRMPG